MAHKKIKKLAEEYGISVGTVTKLVNQVRPLLGQKFDRTAINDHPTTIDEDVFRYWRKYGRAIRDGIHVPPFKDFSRWI